jgi:energy-coupling factor transporter ATP-binding protein EcfA2
MEHKRLTVFAGHYGSGKTNLAVSYALYLASEGKRVVIADLDIVNPYFRTKDSELELRAAGVEVISPRFANSNVDLPALPAESYRLISDRSVYGVIDLGGDDRGAYALGRFADAIREENDFRMALVVNCYRPMTETVEGLVEILHEIEGAAHLPFTDIVNNSNLAEETTAEVVLDSLDYAREASETTGLPIWFHAAEAEVARSLTGLEILPMKLQKKPF